MMIVRAVNFTVPIFLAAALFAGTRSPAAPAGASEVQLVRDDAHQRVDIGSSLNRLLSDGRRAKAKDGEKHGDFHADHVS